MNAGHLKSHNCLDLFGTRRVRLLILWIVHVSGCASSVEN